MTATQDAPLRVVLYEGPGSQPLDDGRRFETLQSLLQAGYAVTRPATGEAVSTADDSRHLVLGQYEGAAPDGDDGLTFRDITGLDHEGVKAQVAEVAADADATPGGWKPWFPVIDYDRCTNCMQCLSFCLFDVYGVDTEQKLQVQKQTNCKTDCPACSRVCPEAAILFPKYRKSPINGAEVKPEDLASESMKVDISALLGGDIYQSLRTRSEDAKKRFSTERDESRALLERKRCLKKLQKDLDIPNEVLMSLPSAENIEDRARRAKEKAEKRRARSQTVKDQDVGPTGPSTDDWGI